MDKEALRQRLQGIEWDDLEVKAAEGGVPEDAYKTVSAFANTAGGWLVFGVSERGGKMHLSGVRNPDALQSAFLTTCRSTEKFSAALAVQARQHELDGVQILAFHIPAAQRFDKPVRVRVRRRWESYVRLGSGDHRCSADEEARFLRDASYETFDSTPVPDVTVEDLDAEDIQWYRGLISQRDPNRAFPALDLAAYLAELGLCRGTAITHAAALLFGGDRLLARLKPGGMVDFRTIHDRWSRDVPENRWDDRELAEGNIVRTLRSLFERLRRLVPQPFDLEAESGQRRALSPEYVATREALVNLLVHQDYTDRQRTARVLWYRDRAVFDNPGDSFVAVAEMLDGGASQLRNPVLVRLLRQAGFAEQAGTGVPSIVRTWRAAGRCPPVLSSDPARKAYRLVLPWDPLVTAADAATLDRLGLALPPEAQRVLVASMQAGGRIHRTDARLVSGPSHQDTEAALSVLIVHGCLVPLATERFQVAEQLLADWKAAQAAVAADTGPSGPVDGLVNGLVNGLVTDTGEPEPQAVPPTRVPTGATARETAMLDLVRSRPGLRVPQLAAELNCTTRTAKRTLNSLKEQGLVVFSGAPKTGGYVSALPTDSHADGDNAEE